LSKSLLIVLLSFVLGLISCNRADDDHANLIEVAKVLNLKTPLKVDKYCTLDSAVVGNKLKLTYYYTIDGIEQDNLDIDVDQAKKSLKSTTQSALDTLKAMSIFKKPITLHYKYNDRDGKHMFDYTIRTKSK